MINPSRSEYIVCYLNLRYGIQLSCQISGCFNRLISWKLKCESSVQHRVFFKLNLSSPVGHFIERHYKNRRLICQHLQAGAHFQGHSGSSSYTKPFLSFHYSKLGAKKLGTNVPEESALELGHKTRREFGQACRLFFKIASVTHDVDDFGTATPRHDHQVTVHARLDTTRSWSSTGA